MAQRHKRDCKRLDSHLRQCNFLYFYSSLWWQSAAWSSATQHAMSPEFGGKLETESLNTRFPLPTPYMQDLA